MSGHTDNHLWGASISSYLNSTTIVKSCQVMILINPKSSNLLSELKAIEPPIWCAMLAQDGDVIFDLEVEDMPTKPFSPIIPYGQYSDNYKTLHNEDILIVVMGANPSVSSTPKIPQAIKLMQQFPQAKITGLHPMATGEATYQIPPPSELVKIKRAKWELLDMSKYRAHNWHCLHDLDSRGNYASLYTSFGCPYDCNFCNIHTIYQGRKVYYRNPRDVIDEIGFLVQEYGIKNLKICDELFTLNHKHIETICGGIKGYNLNIWAYARVGSVNPSLLKTMKEAGINWLCYGFEAGNLKVRQKAAKDYGDIYDTVFKTKRAGINIIGNFMFGLPNDTLDTMCETYSLASSLNCEWANFYCTMAYPGSRIYKGENTDWDSYNQYGDLAVPQWIKDFRDSSFRQYFSSPRYLTMIKEKFGSKAVEHIEYMLEQKIRRD